MLTDSHPRNVNHSDFLESDRITTLDLPQNGKLPEIAKRLQSAMTAGTSTDIRRACADFLAAAFYFWFTPNQYGGASRFSSLLVNKRASDPV